MNVRRWTLLLAALVALSGCDSPTESKGSKGARLRPELVRLKASFSGSPNMALFSYAGDDFPDGPGFVSSDVSIQSLRVPITTIGLINSETGDDANVYQCSSGDCLVELADPDFQSNLLSSSTVTVPVGEYDIVDIGFCKPGSETYTMYVRASVVLNGQTYYTKANGILSTTAPAEDAPIVPSGCGEESRMPAPIVVTDNGSIQVPPDSMTEPPAPVGDAPLRLYFTTEDIAWGAMGTKWAVHFDPWCSVDAATAEAGEPYICVSYPTVAGFLGTGVPTVERYAMDIKSSITLFVRDDIPMGGYLRRHLDGAPNPYLPILYAAGSLHDVSVNADGSVRILGYPTDVGFPEYRFDAFRRETHSGEWADHSGTVMTYSATKVH